MEESESLYYQCCDRIDENIEVAEPFLVGCIHFVIKQDGVKYSRQIIKDHLRMGVFEPYTRELKYISKLQDNLMQALITSSLDFSGILRQVELMHEHAKGSDFNLIQPSTHMNKAKKAGNMLLELSKLMKPTVRVKTDSNLFLEGG